MDKLTIAEPSRDDVQSASAPGDKTENVVDASNFIIVDLNEEDEGSYECCRVC